MHLIQVRLQVGMARCLRSRADRTRRPPHSLPAHTAKTGAIPGWTRILRTDRPRIGSQTIAEALPSDPSYPIEGGQSHSSKCSIPWSYCYLLPEKWQPTRSSQVKNSRERDHHGGGSLGDPGVRHNAVEARGPCGTLVGRSPQQRRENRVVRNHRYCGGHLAMPGFIRRLPSV